MQPIRSKSNKCPNLAARARGAVFLLKKSQGPNEYFFLSSICNNRQKENSKFNLVFLYLFLSINIGKFVSTWSKEKLLFCFSSLLPLYKLRNKFCFRCYLKMSIKIFVCAYFRVKVNISEALRQVTFQRNGWIWNIFNSAVFL